MASAANSSAAATAASPYQGSGAGGKFRKKPFKRSQATPYDRPPTSLRPAAQSGGSITGGWFSKILDPASKLITAGAHRLFSSVFQKRLLAPPSPSPPPKQEVEQLRGSDEVNKIADMQPGATTNVFASVTNNTTVPGDNDTSGVPDCNGVAELENILKQKSFTRSEIDRLTELLSSRAAENLVGAEQQGRSEPNFLDTLSGPGRHENLPNPPAYENRTKHAVFAAVSTPEVRTKVLKDDAASPAEIAKAYMGSRPTNVSRSDLGFQNHRLKEELSASYNPLSTRKSSSPSLVQKSVSQIENSTNGFITPRYRGRSAIYNMARTPYSRVNSPALLKAAETDINDGCRSLPYLKSMENNQPKKQVLKRRSTILENDIGSVGPIRRIRQKPNLLHPKTLSLPSSNRQATHVSGVMSDVAEVPSSMKWISQNHCLSKVEENNMPGTSGGYVPSQSVEMAQKIFQHLDKFVPTQKSPEKKTGVSVESSLSMSTLPTLNGFAHKSLGNVDSLKTLGSTQVDKKDDSGLNSDLEKNHPHKMSSFVNDVSAQNSLVSSSNMALQKGKTAHHLPVSCFDRPQKSRGFQMSAFEDVDNDVPSAVAVTSTPLTEGVNEREHTELSKKFAATTSGLSQDKLLAYEKPASPELEPSTSSLLVKERESLANGSPAAESTGCLSAAFTLSSTSKVMPEAVSIFGSIPLSDKVSSYSDKSLPLSPFIPPTAVEAPLKDSKLQAPNSAHDTAAKANSPDRIDIKSSTLKPGGIPVTSSANIAFSSVFQTNNPTPSNGLQSSLRVSSGAPSLFGFQSNLNNQGPAPASVSNGTADHTSDSCTAAVGICLSSAASNSMSALFGSGSHPNSSVTAPLSFKPWILSDSSAVSTLATPATVFTSKSGDTALSTAAASLASVKPLPPPTNGNNIFGCGAPTLISPTSEAQPSAAPASSGSQLSFQAQMCSTSFSAQPVSFLGPSASSVSAPNLTSTFTFTGLSSASVSTPVFGITSPAPSYSSSTPVFGSSPVSPSLSGSAVSALGSSMSLSASTSVTMPSLSGGSWQSSKPMTSAPLFTAASPSTAFLFGSTTSGSSASTTSNTAAATFPFGSTHSGSSAAATTNTAATMQFVFGGTSSATSGSGPQFVFGSSSGAAAPSIFSPASAAVSTPATSAPIFQSQPVFGNPSPSPFGFASNLSSNNDQMTMEDSMAEDSMQPSTPAVQTLGSPLPATTPSGNLFPFNGQQNQFGGPPSTTNPFGFNSQPNPFVPQNTPQFQPSGSGEFTPGNNGSFSIGSVDKSQRKTFKAKRNRPLTRK